MQKDFREALEDSPVIAAVKNDAGLGKCLTCDSKIIFILYGDILTIPQIVETVKSAGKNRHGPYRFDPGAGFKRNRSGFYPYIYQS